VACVLAFTRPRASNYTAHGAVAQVELGNQLWESADYDPARLQVSEMRLGTSAQASDRWRLTNGYGASATNNGNVRSQTLTLPGWTASQSFDYDLLNRIQSASEGTSWTRTFDGDQYGNHWVSGWTGLSPWSFTPVSAEWYDARNRITGAPSAGFDAAGNQTQLGGYHFDFDAENRLTASTINDVRTTYSYDGEGRRVKKVAGGNTTVFVYDAAGQLAAEYSTEEPAGIGTQYVTVDHLGSTRLVTDASGVVTSCHDFLPLGAAVPQEPAPTFRRGALRAVG
jgi:YD repeat-containing protein